MQKMSALGFLAGGMAHDFNNVLQGIMGLCDMILMGVIKPEEYEQCVQEIRSESVRGSELSRQLLSYMRDETQSPILLDLNRLVDGLQNMLRRLLGRRIRIVFSASGECMVSAVKMQLEQVVMNLCINARDAMPNGGVLKINSKTLFFEESGLSECFGHRAGTYACLSISDNGSGMTEEVKRSLFRPLFTTKPEGRGTGMGLSLVHDIVERHGGWIGVDSQEGHGSVFHVFLPLVDAPPESESVSTTYSEVSDLRGHGELILLLEDDPVGRSVLRRTLEQHGFRVVCAESSDDALAAFRQRREEFGLFISNVTLPGKSGFLLAQEFVAQRAGLLVILMSGFQDEVVGLPEIERAGFSFLEKPFGSRRMLETVRECFSQK